VWRIGRGPYLVLPVLGPTTLRDAVGGAGDRFLDPLDWELLQEVDGYDWTWSAALEAVDTVKALPGAVAAYDAVSKDALDPYIALRSAYVQNRDAETKQ
jgi:phospholipid-binding lipoprotein MlaA